MIVVADSSALISLATCDSLDLLNDLFDDVLVPESVFKEVTRGYKPRSQALREYLRDKVRKVDMRDFIYLDAYADAGETEAMLLCKQISADKLLIDDKRGRKIAKINNISTVGSLGVLLAAKKAGVVSDIAPLVYQISDSPVYLDSNLIETVLELAGEPIRREDR